MEGEDLLEIWSFWLDHGLGKRQVLAPGLWRSLGPSSQERTGPLLSANQGEGVPPRERLTGHFWASEVKVLTYDLDSRGQCV